MHADFLVVKPCRSGKAYDVRGRQKISLDLRKVAQGLPKESIKAETPDLLVVELEGCAVTIYRSGKVLVRGAESDEEALAVAERVYSLNRKEF